jgi:uncharacterized 2Fe-2S/4Fe-4S cluster protein (DUF4445 family)
VIGNARDSRRETRNPKLLLALDLGTTTLAGRLIGGDGTVFAEAQAPNPQAIVGADVIRRLEAALKGEGERLQALLAGGINTLTARLLAEAGAVAADIKGAAAAANPAVTCLLRNLAPAAILFPPHRPRERDGILLDPAPPGLHLPVPLYVFPLVSGYVGGDLIAFLYGYEEISRSPVQPGPPRLFLDIGTNGEMALFSGEKWWTTSVAAGPAFEGAEIVSGMPAVAGAVEGVDIEGDRLRLRVIGGGTPRGVCGSGLAAAVAAALDGGLIDPRGTILDPAAVPTNLSRHLAETPAGRALRLYRDAAVDLLLTQEDVRRFQLAKGAVRAGVDCLLQRAGVAAGDLRQVVVTGAFGLSLPPAVLKRIAMLPAPMVDKVLFIPGGALAGVCRFLRDPDGAEQVQALAAVLRPYPLSGTPAFEAAFLQGLDF